MTNQKGGIFIIGICLTIIFIISVFIAIAVKEQAERNPPIIRSSSTDALKTTSLEGNQINKKLTREDAVILPSGAKVTLTNFIYQIPNTGQAAPEIKQLDMSVPINKYLRIFHQGYIYDITRTECISKPHLDLDVMRDRLEECQYTITAIKQNPPPVSYNITKTFSSASDQQAPYDDKSDIIKNSPEESYYQIDPSYIHLYDHSGLKKYELSGSGYAIIDTAYGSKYFIFTPEELLKHTSQTQQIGPLTLTLKVENHSCYPPYLASNGECTDDEYPPVYNKFDFNLKIEQTSQEPQPIQIIDSS